ncbi:MAG: hypothetical protein CVV34_01705 [Methanomicrobiales archaeon HGW-Methanomicrobiales-5]|nr:MAG: hypothetical protein CVV34_01705 [Methanomicrobiales archaeon HGW-Methanomicrobiales-5]
MFIIRYLITPFPDYPVPDNAYPDMITRKSNPVQRKRSGDEKFVVCFFLSTPQRTGISLI